MTDIASIYLAALNEVTNNPKEFSDSPEVVYEALGILADHFGTIETDAATLTAAIFRDGRHDNFLTNQVNEHRQTVLRKTLTDLRALALARWDATAELLAHADHDAVRLFSALFLARLNVYETAYKRTQGLTDRRSVWEHRQLQEIVRVFGNAAAKHSEPIARAVSDKAGSLLKEAQYCYWRLDFFEETPELPEDIENLFSRYGMAWGRINDSLSYAFRTPTEYASFAASLAAHLQNKAHITKLISNNDIFVFEYWLNGYGFWTRMAMGTETDRHQYVHPTNWINTDSKYFKNN